MTTFETLTIIIAALGLLVNGIIVAVAVMGDTIRSWFAGPKLRLVLNPRGNLTPINTGVMRIYYALTVENGRPSVTATNCRVQIRRMWRRGETTSSTSYRCPTQCG
jgi:hypothetical protein